jgi:hypothetical protein
MVASTVCWTSGRKKLWRLYVNVMLKPQIHWRRPVSGLHSRPGRSKSISATSPGGVGHAHRIAATAAQLDGQTPDEAFQGGVRNVHAAPTEQVLHARQLQMVVLQPSGDLLAIWLQPIRLEATPTSAAR